MGDTDGIATRASKRRRISAPVQKPKAKKRGRQSSPEGPADETNPPLQRVTAVTIPTLQNVEEETHQPSIAPALAPPSPQPTLSPNHITPEKPHEQTRVSPKAPSSYSPVTQYDDEEEEEEEEVDIVKAVEEIREEAEHPQAQLEQQDAPVGTPTIREGTDLDISVERDEENAAEEEAEDEKYESAQDVEKDEEHDLEAEAEDEKYESAQENNHLTTDVVHNFYRNGYNKSFSESARRNSHDVKPSRSPSAPAYSRISTPLASPMPEPPKEAVYRPYKLKMTLTGHKRGVAMVRVSPNGKMIVSCSADATIRIWDSATGKHLNTFEGHLAGISALAWAPDSKTLASGSDDKSIRLWNVRTGKAHPHPLVGHHNYIYSIAFSPKGNILVSGSYDEAVFLWDIRTRRILRSLPAHSDPVGGVDFVRDGTLIVSCAGDGLIRIWDTGTGQCLRTLVHEDNAPVTSVRFSPNGKFVLAWTLDACVRLWDYVEGRCMKTYQGHTNGKFSLGGAFGVYGEDLEKALVVSGSEDGGLFVWDVVNKTVLQRIEGAHNGVVLGVDTARGWIVSGGVDRMVKIWEREEIAEEEEQVKENGVEAVGDKMEGIEGPAEHSSNAFLQVPIKEEHSSQV